MVDYYHYTDWECKIIQNIRNDTNHTIASGNTTISGTVTTDVTTSNPIGVGSWSTQQITQRATNMDFAEILIYNSALSDSNRLLIENYLSQKYDLDVENGLDFNGTSVELIDLNSSDKKILFEFLDNETLSLVDCNYSYKNKKLTIKGCSSDVVIKVRFRNNGIIPTNQKPKITKTKENIITKDKFDSLSEQSYYLKLYNKILSLENTTNRPTTKIYKNTTQYLTENGFLENVFVEIKPFN